MPEINDAILMHEAGNPNNPAAGLPRQEPVRGHEVVDEVWEEKNDKDINIIQCASISFAQGETLELQPGQTKKLEVVQDPFISNIPYLTFESSDLNVVQIIDDCVAYACGEEGEAIVTASSSDGSGLVATITITVAKKTQEEGGDEPEPEPEPEVNKGKFEFSVPQDIKAGQEVSMGMTFTSDVAYENVYFKFSGPADMTVKMTDSTGTEYSFQGSGFWGKIGEGQGFNVTENYSATSQVNTTFASAGTFTVEFSLVHAEDESVIVNGSLEAVVGAAEETITTQALKSKKKS